MSKDLNNEEKLNAIYEMTLENNDILRVIRRQQYLANALRLLYWLIVLGAIGGAYYFVRPVVQNLSNNSGKIEETYSQLRSQMPETKLFEQIMDSLKTKDTTVKPAQNSDSGMPDNGVIDASTTSSTTKK